MEVIRVIGTIDEEAYKKFSEELHECEAAGVEELEIELCSEGGYAMIALAFYSKMRLSPIKFTVTGYGEVASAATLILVGGDYRRLTKESWVLLHEDSGKTSGTTTIRERQILNDRRKEDQWLDIFFKHCYDTKDVIHKIYSYHEEETVLNPKQCLQLGMIDEII